jgi:hypothetical protein
MRPEDLAQPTPGARPMQRLLSTIAITLVTLTPAAWAQTERPPSTNVALGKPATQSTTDFGGDASRAVDGNIDGGFFNGSVTHTVGALNQWWMVDLGAEHLIDSVIVYNRTDCCSERLRARVAVSYSSLWSSMKNCYLGDLEFTRSSPARAAVSGAMLRGDYFESCYGRYVYVLQNWAQPLSLAEVVVLGSPRPQ